MSADHLNTILRGCDFAVHHADPRFPTGVVRILGVSSSGVGKVGKAYWGAYSASKFGIESLSQMVAAEHEHTAVRSNCINPGPVRTRMRLEAYPAEDRDKVPEPKDILAGYVYLLSTDSRAITGQSFDIQ